MKIKLKLLFPALIATTVVPTIAASCGFSDLFGKKNEKTKPDEKPIHDQNPIQIIPKDEDKETPKPKPGVPTVIETNPVNPPALIKGSFNNQRIANLMSLVSENKTQNVINNLFDPSLAIAQNQGMWNVSIRDISSKVSPIFLKIAQIDQFVKTNDSNTKIIGFKVLDHTGKISLTLQNNNDKRNVIITGFAQTSDFLSNLNNLSNDERFDFFLKLLSPNIGGVITINKIQRFLHKKENEFLKIVVEDIQDVNNLGAVNIADPNRQISQKQLILRVRAIVTIDNSTQEAVYRVSTPIIFNESSLEYITVNKIKKFAIHSKSEKLTDIISKNLMGTIIQNGQTVADTQDTETIWNKIKQHYSFTYDNNIIQSIKLKANINNGRRTHFILRDLTGKVTINLIATILGNNNTNKIIEIKDVELPNMFDNDHYDLIKNISSSNIKFKDSKNYYTRTAPEILTKKFTDWFEYSFNNNDYVLEFRDWKYQESNIILIYSQLRNKTTNIVTQINQPIILDWFLKTPTVNLKNLQPDYFTIDTKAQNDFAATINLMQAKLDSLESRIKFVLSNHISDKETFIQNFNGEDINESNIYNFIKIDLNSLLYTKEFNAYFHWVPYFLQNDTNNKQLIFNVGVVLVENNAIKFNINKTFAVSYFSNELSKKIAIEKAAKSVKFNDIQLNESTRNMTSTFVKSNINDYLTVSIKNVQNFNIFVEKIIEYDGMLAFKLTLKDKLNDKIKADTNNWFLYNHFTDSKPLKTKEAVFMSSLKGNIEFKYKTDVKNTQLVIQYDANKYISTYKIDKTKSFSIKDNKFVFSFSKAEIDDKKNIEEFKFIYQYQVLDDINKNSLKEYYWYSIPFEKSQLPNAKTPYSIPWTFEDKKIKYQGQIIFKDGVYYFEFIIQTPNIVLSSNLMQSAFNNTDQTVVINKHNSYLIGIANGVLLTSDEKSVVESINNGNVNNNFNYSVSLKDNYKNGNWNHQNINDKTKQSQGFVPNYTNYTKDSVPEQLVKNMMRTFAENGTYWMLSKVKPNDPTDLRYYVGTNVHVVASNEDFEKERDYNNPRLLRQITIPYFDPLGNNFTHHTIDNIFVRDFWRAKNQTSKDKRVLNGYEDIAISIIDVNDILTKAKSEGKLQVYRFFDNWKNLPALEFSDIFNNVSGNETNIIQPLFMAGFPNGKFDLIQLNRLNAEFIYGKEHLKSGNTTKWYSVHSMSMSVTNDKLRPLFILPGSSGTLVTDTNGKAVGILNSGNQNKVSFKLFNNSMFNYLGITKNNDPTKISNKNSFVNKVIQYAIKDPNNFEIIEIAKGKW